MKTKTNKFIALAILAAGIFIASVEVRAQDKPGDVTVSREAAIKCLEATDRVKALEAEIAVKNEAIDKLKTEIQNLQRQFVEASTESSMLKQQAVRDAAIIELLLKYVKPKKIGLVVF